VTSSETTVSIIPITSFTKYTVYSH
jgi:hypothetical protein